MESDAKTNMTALWLKYRDTKSVDLRNEIAEHYLPLVKIVCGRLAVSLPQHLDKDDLLSSGFFGAGKAGNPFQTTQGNRLSCRDQEGRRSLNEVVLGTSVFPLSETGVLGDFWGCIKGAKYRFAPLHILSPESTPPINQILPKTQTVPRSTSKL